MISLHSKFEDLKAAIGKAFHFADPEAYIKDRETEFKKAVADAVHELDTRLTAVEQHPALSVPEQSSKPEEHAELHNAEEQA